MSQFFGVFFEESQEHLDEMERLLMDLSLDNPDIEELNSIFRAAHSIKGGSGIFGFDALTGLTHVMENILDLARKVDIAMTKTIVDQLLITVDTLKQILQCYQNEQDIDWAAIELGTKALENLLKNNVNDEESNSELEENQGFGFFENPVINTDNDGFGFFDAAEQVHNTQRSNAIDEHENIDTPLKKKRQDASTCDDNEDFGFFDDEPADPQQTIETQNKAALNNAAPQSKKPVSKNTVVAEHKDSSSIRVDTLKIDSLVNLVGELVITQSMIKIVGKDVHGETEEKLDGAINELSRNIREIQEAVMSMRMLPMSFAFNRFPRLVRDLADQLEKDIDLLIEGGATEIDKGVIEKLVDPLTHLVRNSIDHGIELPDIREAAGKPRKGTVVLAAEQRGGSILITISDDGGGLNRQDILQKANSNGFDVSEDMPDDQVWALIFEAGFSTAQEVTDVSGRGVGMDVVRRNIESIGGIIEIESTQGVGCVFRIRLPLTLAIVDGMCVSVSDQTFVVPLTNIIESMQPSKEQIKTLKNDHLLWVRGEYWPLVTLHQMMGIDNAITEPTEAIVVLVETSRRRFGILVDALSGQQQVVIKSLEQHYKRVPGVAGATIMGDGSVAMILDVESIAAQVNTFTPQEVSIAS